MLSPRKKLFEIYFDIGARCALVLENRDHDKFVSRAVGIAMIAKALDEGRVLLVAEDHRSMVQAASARQAAESAMRAALSGTVRPASAKRTFSGALLSERSNPFGRAGCPSHAEVRRRMTAIEEMSAQRREAAWNR